jgi:DNA/RNA-binding domain of Phe-tRNA-synthetase-like protein
VNAGPDVLVSRGLVASEVAAEFPGLALHWTRVTGGVGRSPAHLVARLRQLANGFRGPAVIALRTKPVPAAYRNFFRQIGLDPDVNRPPGERAALVRLFDGTFRPEGWLPDALLVALLETGVPVWALDPRRVDALSLGIRTAGRDEQLGGGGPPVGAGTLVVADAVRIHAVLFDPPSPDCAPGPGTRELVLFSVSVEGVPLIHVEEAFWLAAEALRGSV